MTVNGYCNTIAITMTHHATQTLQDLGYRLTPQRTLVWDVLRQSQDHLGADEICLRVQKDFPHVNISTVYRTLELLVELDLVRETHLGPNRRYYEVEEGEPHHHLVCTDCGSVMHLDHQQTGSFRSLLSKEKEFAVREVSVFGSCNQCLPRQSTTAKQ